MDRDVKTSNDQRIKGLEGIVGKRGERIKELESTVSKHDRRIGELEGAIGRLDERIGELESTVNRRNRRIGESPGVLLVTHDTLAFGAQMLMLSITRGFVEQLGLDVYVASLGEDGELLSQFEEFGTVYKLHEEGDVIRSSRRLARKLHGSGVRRVLLNTVVTGIIAEVMKSEGFRVVNLIHELPNHIAKSNLEQAALTTASNSDVLVFASPVVEQGFKSITTSIVSDVEIRPQGIYNPIRNKIGANKSSMRQALCASIGIDESAKIVIGVGYADHRKGVDLFMDIASRIRNERPSIHFIWVGRIDLDFISPSDHDTPGTNVHFVGYQEDVVPFFAGADILAMTSREDPFPSVVLEAMDVGMPIIGFENAGGFSELLREGVGILVPYEDTAIFADEICKLCSNSDRSSSMGNVGQRIITDRFGWTQYLLDLARMLELPSLRV